MLGDEAHSSLERLFMGSGYVRSAGGPGGEPDRRVSGTPFRGHADNPDAAARRAKPNRIL